MPFRSNSRFYFHDPSLEKKKVTKISTFHCTDDSFSNCSTKFTLNHRFQQDENDSDSEDGHFSPMTNPNLKVYSVAIRLETIETPGTGGHPKPARGGQIMEALRRSKQKRSANAQKASSQ